MTSLLVASAIACGAPSKPDAPSSAPDSGGAATPSSDAAAAADAAAPVAGDSPDAGTSASASAAGGAGAAGEGDPHAALAAAKAANKPAFIAFCARWVAACGELAHSLAASEVKKTLDERFVVARVDVSNEDDPATKERMKQYKVKGLPFVIVFDRKGKEVARESGILDAARISKLLDKAK